MRFNTDLNPPWDDIKGGDKIELIFEKNDAVIIGTVLRKYRDRVHDISRFELAGLGTISVTRDNDADIRILYRPVNKPAVGQIINRTAYATLPYGTVIHDAQIGYVCISMSGADTKRVRKMSGNYSWPSLNDASVLGCITHLPAEGNDPKAWETFNEKGWNFANG